MCELFSYPVDQCSGLLLLLMMMVIILVLPYIDDDDDCTVHGGGTICWAHVEEMSWAHHWRHSITWKP